MFEIKGSPIIFDDFKRGDLYYLEAVATENIGFCGPLALGVIKTSKSNGSCFRSLLVHDALRRSGLGRAMVVVAGYLWPGIKWEETEASRKFHQKLCREGIACDLGCGWYQLRMQPTDDSINYYIQRFS